MAEPVDAPGLGPGPFGGGGSSPLVRTLVPHLVAAPDKFRGTATAAAVAGAAARAARRCGWRVEEMPLADGGEGSMTAVRHAIGGELRERRVTGPLGYPVNARWLFLADTSGALLPRPLVAGHDPTAVVEAAEAAGRHLVPAPSGDEPLDATTAGVGQLVDAALAAGARQVLVFVGGTATTDGGRGAISALEAAEAVPRRDLRLVVATDVQTRFRTAAAVFSPQKGATPLQSAKLEQRLTRLASHYRRAYGAEVDRLSGAGAGGGLAGGLAAIGGTIVAGFPLVAGLVGLERRLAAADLAMTGEGRLDATSFAGKVVGGVCGALGGTVPVLCVAGEVTDGATHALEGRAAPVEVVSLVERVGRRRALDATTAAVEDVVVAALLRHGVGHRM